MGFIKVLSEFNWIMIFVYFAAVYGIYTMIYSVVQRVFISLSGRNGLTVFKPGILLIVKNGQHFIEGLVHTIARQCIENDTPQFTIVDDDSSDQTPEILRIIAKNYPFIKFIRIVPSSKKSPVEAGLEVCEGEIVAVIDVNKRLPVNAAEEATGRFLKNFGSAVSPLWEPFIGQKT